VPGLFSVRPERAVSSGRRIAWKASLLMLAIFLTHCGSGSVGGAAFSAAGPPTSAQSSGSVRTLRAPLSATSILRANGSISMASLCSPSPDPTQAGCLATVRTDAGASSVLSDAVYGLTPTDLSTIYAYPAPAAQGSLGEGQLVGIIVAYNYPSAESDLAVYRSHFGLPPCTSANDCFRKVGAAAPSTPSSPGDPTSFSAHPGGGAGWAAETDADMDVISAVCPNCKIMLAEAASAGMADLGAAAQVAVQAGATIMNASFGAPEANRDASFAPMFENGQHIKVVAAAGDWGTGVLFPAATGKVIAVAGTSLTVSGTTLTETMWSHSGYGCSQYFGKQGWQQNQLCHNRLVADVAALADPATGIAFYDSTLSGTNRGWGIVGGTSISAPIIAGMYALSGNTANGEGPGVLYQNGAHFLSIGPTSGAACLPNAGQQCQATANIPTGLGVPQGLSGF
jgi:subtilase family serine protease